jgi:hypothetical protein
MDSLSQPDDPRSENDGRKDKKKGFVWSVLLHLALLFIAFLPFMTYPVPPPGQEGVLVSFGEAELGEGEDLPSNQSQENIETFESLVEEIRTSDLSEEVQIISNTSKSEVKNTKEPAEKVVPQQSKEPNKKQEVLPTSEAENYNNSKNQFGDLFGKGKGNTDIAGNQGAEDGDPTAKALSGISSGNGIIGGGLSGRGLSYQPKIKDNSQKTGKIVVKVCVNQQGDVVSAEYTQLGSTSTDFELRQIATQSALLFKFTASNIDRQCGTISIDFKLK